MNDTQTEQLAALTQKTIDGVELNEDQRVVLYHLMALEKGKINVFLLIPHHASQFKTSATLKSLYISHLISHTRLLLFVK